jgi:hypothetical protein
LNATLLPRAQPTRLALLLKQKLQKPHNFRSSIVNLKSRVETPGFFISGDGMTGKTSMLTARSRRLLCIGVVIVAGLALRSFGYHVGLPFAVVKYGGSLLWGCMVFLFVASAMMSRHLAAAGAIALAIAAAVEFSRLYQTPTLDEFRLTLAGKLLLGRVFSLWNIVAYAAGIGLGMAIEMRLRFLDRNQ